MSKLAKAIEAKVFYDDARASRLPLPRYFEVESDISHYAVEREFRVSVGVKFEQTIWLSDVDVQKSSSAFEHAKTQIKRAMIEEIFGEFRPILNEINVATYEQNYNKIRYLFAKLEDQMFSEGL